MRDLDTVNLSLYIYAMRVYNFRINEELDGALKVLKARDGVPESEAIRRALREYLITNGILHSPHDLTDKTKAKNMPMTNTAMMFLTITKMPNDPLLAETIADAVCDLLPEESWVHAGYEPLGERDLSKEKSWGFRKRQE